MMMTVMHVKMLVMMLVMTRLMFDMYENEGDAFGDDEGAVDVVEGVDVDDVCDMVG